MINWWMVLTSSLWIGGLSILVATFSYHHWMASTSHRSLFHLYGQPFGRLAWSVGILLISLGGLLGQSDRWWPRACWLTLTAACCWGLLRSIKSIR